MDRVTSGDGTAIAFDRFGEGPPVVLVGPGPSWYGPLAAELAEHFTVFNYDRRGRGESGDTAPYAVEREIEDLGAIIAEAGGSASVYGHSAGAALALRAAAHDLPIDGLVLHEPPYAPEDDEEEKRASRELAATFKKLLAEGRRGEAIAHVFNNTGLPREMAEDLMPPEAVEALSRDEGVLAMAHTFAYDLEVMGDSTDGTAPTDTASAVPIPTLVLNDGADYPWAIEAGRRLARALPKGRHVLLKSQDPEELYASPEVLAQTVAEFLTDRDDGPVRARR